jgi:MFS family permease
MGKVNPMPVREGRLSTDFWRFWSGQTISNFGNSVTAFAVPLLIFKLTGSAVNLGLSAAAEMLPYLLFGLVIGAWVDRVDRKRLMILADLARAAVIGSIPLLAAIARLDVWWIYGAGFVNATISIAFDASQFAAIPSLVPSDDLVTANGRIQASFSAATILGPLVAGGLIAVIPVESIFALDAVSFVGSAICLSLIARSFNSADTGEPRGSIRADVSEGLRYVWSHPVLRNISIMMALVNFFASTIGYQLVLFATERLHASNSRIGFLFAANAAGVVVLSLLAGVLRKRWSFGTVALGALMVDGALTAVFALMTSYWPALVVWAIYGGCGVLFNINTGSLRQSIVPNELLGRVISVAGVLAWSAIPLGTLLGGFAIQRTGNVALVYGLIGIATFTIAFFFRFFTPLGHAERYLSAEPSAIVPQPAEAG